MLDTAIAFFHFFLIVLFLCGAFLILQIVIERFILTTIPIIGDCVDRIRNSDKYSDQ